MERGHRRRISVLFLASAAFFIACGVVPACHLINGIDDFTTDPILDIDASAPCATENDCPGTDTECSQRTCISNACGTKFTLKGTPVLEQVVGDCLVNQCDGVGHRVDDIVDTSDILDDGKECSVDACSLTGKPTHDPAMAGTPCAMETKVCDGQGECVECVVDTHCMIDRVCSMSHCVSKTCVNGMKDGQESDIDCGGTECQACTTGMICTTGADCQSKTCTMGLCAEPACDDMQPNGDETDVDCGGSCDPCADGKSCIIPMDCASNVCKMNVCQMPTCNDGVQNGDEINKDCGGSCGGCPGGTPCSANLDCSSEFCLSGICAKIVQVATGTAHTCAVVEAVAGEGKLFCWGGNNYGELGAGGMGTAELKPMNTPVDLPNVTSVSTFSNTTMTLPVGSHTCARTEQNGVATFKCWGRNENGQLGNGSTTPSVTPVNIAFSAGVVPTQVVAGGRHTCAITSLTGVQCWGSNGQGQCGTGAGTNTYTTPQNAPNFTGAVQLALGTVHTCARLMTNGEVACWGSNTYGQLGFGATAQSTPRKLTSISAVMQLATGQDFTCGLTATKAFCWGDDSDKQFGEGVQQSAITPLEVLNVIPIAPLPLTMGASGINAMPDTTGGHTCFLEANGKLVCLGLNDRGQVGAGNTTSPINMPTQVGTDAFKQVALGTQFTCGILEKGPIRCWGRNDLGQLGNESTMDSSTPVAVKWPGST